MFFNSFDEEMRKIFNTDIEKHNVLAYIIYKVNYQEQQYEGLKTGECHFSYSSLEETTKISHKTALRIMKEVEEDGIIKWVFKSKTKHKKSIILFTKMEPVNAPVKEPVKELSSINKSKNKSNNSASSEAQEIEINNIWGLYPNKKGKAVAIKKIPGLIKQYGYEQLIRCVERYSSEVQGKDNQYIKQGSTFFNGGYMDYLDENYEVQAKVINMFRPD